MEDKKQRGETESKVLLGYANSIIATLREPFLVLDKNLQVISANRVFYTTFKVTEKDAIGRLLPDLGNRQWNIPKLLQLLKEIIPEKKVVKDYEVEHKFEQIGQRVMCLNALQLRVPKQIAVIIAAGVSKQQQQQQEEEEEEELILLAIEDITEPKRLQEELKASEERYRRAFETSRDGLLLVHKTEADILNSNESARELLDYSPEEFLKKKLWEIGVVKDDKDFQGMVSRLEKDGVIHYEDTPVKTKKGLSINSEVFLVNKAKVIQCNIRDITERKKAESDVLETSWQLQKIIASVGDGITLSDKNGRFEIFSPKMQEMTGYTFGEVAASSDFSALIYPEPEARKEALAALDEVKVTGYHEAETVIRTKDGTEKILLVATSLMSYKGSDMFLSVYHDITEHRRLENELLQARERQLKVLVENLPGKVFLKDRNSVYISCNENYAKDLKIKPEEIVGKSDYDFFPTHLAEKYRADDKRVMESGKTENIEESFLVTNDFLKSTQEVFVNTIKAPILDKKGNVRGVLGFFWDITERKKAEEALRENEVLKRLNQIKSDFVSIVSHELRTPLSITKEALSLVLDRIPGEINEKQSRILNTAKSSIDRLANIINELLDVSKIEAGKTEMKIKLLDIVAIIKQVISGFERQAKEKNLKLETDFSASKIEIYADSDKIVQIFTNLVNNAIKFTEKGSIKISAKKLEDKIECAVSDTGIGISQDSLPKVFDKFQQFSRVIGPGEKGTGLGLSIVKGLVDMHEGDIRVESQLGKGTKFTLTLLRHDAESLFKEYINKGIKLAAKKGSKMSLVFVSLADFKEAKKQMPKEELGLILKEMCGVLKNTVRREDDIVVEGTSEIAVILPECNKEGCHVVEERLKKVLYSYLKSKKATIPIKLHFGCATPDDATAGEDLIRKAREGAQNNEEKENSFY
ncbi:MAG: PAS domain S-box protein [Candidatus Omnitrophota bacterium]